MSALKLREGFWHSKYEPLLPKPVPNDKPWKGQRVLLEALSEKQSKLRMSRYKGSSKCRCCGITNGSGDYKLGAWVWPEGLAHYIKAHNVRPSLAFQEFILGRQLGDE